MSKESLQCCSSIRLHAIIIKKVNAYHASLGHTAGRGQGAFLMQEKGKKLKPICALFTSNSCQQYRHFPSKNHHFSHYMRPLCNKGGSILTLTNVSKVQFFCIDIKIVFLPAARLVNMCCWSKGRGGQGTFSFLETTVHVQPL